MSDSKIKVGISSCLLGNEVRFDGGHKQSSLCTDTLSRYFDFIAECPEVGIGLSIPRPPIRLIGDVNKPQAVLNSDNSVHFTDDLAAFGQAKAREHTDLSGYIFMKNSPSCGLFRVKVYQQNNIPHRDGGRGIYANVITEAYPLLPVEESGRLMDPSLRENFITRVFAYSNWQQLRRQGLSSRLLIDFHSRYKYCLMAHAPQKYSELGKMLADAGKHDPLELGERYFAELMAALSQLATRKSHTNALMHIQGYLKAALSPEEKQELSKIIEQYRLGHVPLIVPMVMLKHHFARHPDEYISRQAYMQPYPEDLGLRNVI